MTDTQPDMTAILNQMILASISTCVADIEAKLTKKILIENKPFITVDDFAELTGLKKTTIYQYCKEGKIGYYRPTGKHTFFSWNNVKEFILNEKYYNKANSEIRRKVQSDFLSKNV